MFPGHVLLFKVFRDALDRIMSFSGTRQLQIKKLVTNCKFIEIISLKVLLLLFKIIVTILQMEYEQLLFCSAESISLSLIPKIIIRHLTAAMWMILWEAKLTSSSTRRLASALTAPGNTQYSTALSMMPRLDLVAGCLYSRGPAIRHPGHTRLQNTKY